MRPDMVAVINSNVEIIEAIEELLHHAGFHTVAEHLLNFKRGEADLGAFLEKHDPAVVIVDFPPPYESNVRFFRGHMEPQLEGRGLVLTTTNHGVVEMLLGREVYEILGKPFDLERIVRAVRRSLRNNYLPMGRLV